MDHTSKRVTCTKATDEVFSNMDLLTMILLYIPAICLLRLKQTCRSWNTLISSKVFSDSHAKRHFASRTVRGLYGSRLPIANFYKQPLQQINNGLPTFRFLFNNARDRFVRQNILSSTNGLMLCETDQTLFVFNPTTQMRKAIGPTVSSLWDVGHHISFYPYISNEYKVIRITTVYANSSESFKIEIYSSATLQWKEITINGPYQLDKKVRQVLCNGVIYWLTKAKMLLMFHVDNEVMTSTRYPVYPRLGMKVLWCGEVSGCVFVADTEFNNSNTLCIFRLDLDDPRWIVVANIDMSHMIDVMGPPPDGIRSQPKVLCLKENNQEIPMVVFVLFKRMLLYNTTNNTFEVIRNMLRDSQYGTPAGVGAVYPWENNFKFIDSLAYV